MKICRGSVTKHKTLQFILLKKTVLKNLKCFYFVITILYLISIETKGIELIQLQYIKILLTFLAFEAS